MKLSLAQIINKEEHENSGTGHEENISKEEKIALTYLKKHKNKDFFIKTTDKNLGPSIMGRKWYFKAGNSHLSSVTYKKLSKGEVPTIISYVIFTLKFLVKKYSSVIDKNEQAYLLSMIHSFIIPLFYTIPKSS